MKTVRNTVRPSWLSVATAVLFATTAVAQTTAPTQPATTTGSTASTAAEREEEVITLSPFEVDASNDIGYFAENTLAGSRLNTNVGDLAASITVVTKQQLEDTAAIDINDVFLYESNTEGAATYTPYIFNRSLVRDGIGGYSSDEGATSSIATANRVRGLGSVDTARNNYPTISRLTFDSYNTNSVEINRGPNSMLFGTGSPAGIVNQSTTEAVLEQKQFTLSTRIGSFGAHRLSFGANIPVGDKMAFYVAALYDERGFQRKPSSDKYRRQFAAVTIKPFSKTKITASVENYDNRNNRPNYILPSDYVTPWIEAGKPGWNPATQMVTFANGTTRGPYLASTLDPRYVAGVTPLQGNLTDTTSPFFIPGLNYIAGRNTLRIDEGGILHFWVPQSTTGGTAPGLPAAGSRTAAQWLIASARYTTSRNALAPRPPASTGATEYGRWTEVSIADKSIYDWEEYNVQGGNYGRQEAKTFNIELQQEILPNLNFSAGWFRQEFEEWTHYGLGQANQASRLYVDTNTHFLDGTPNPYFGSPYVFDSQLDTFYVPENNDNLRAMLAYDLDFTKRDGWTRWLGRHRFLGLATRQKVWRNNLRYRLSFDGGDPRFLPSAASLAATGNGRTSWAGNASSIQRIFYMGQNPDGVVERGVTVVESPGYGGPDSASLNFYDWNASPQHYSQADMSFHQNLFYAGGNYGVFKKTLDATNFAWQGYLWDDRIVPTLGWREDEVEIRSFNSRKADGTALTNEDRYTGGFGNPGLWNLLGDPLNVKGTTETRGVVVRPFKGWDSIVSSADNGNFFAGLLEGLSFHYNESDNFNPPPGIQVDFFENRLPFPSGEGKDYGFGVSLFDNKLNLRVNWYESSNKNAPSPAANTVITRTVRIDTSSVRRWGEYVVRIRHGQDPATEEEFHNNTMNPLSATQIAEIEALIGVPWDWPNFEGTIAGTESNTSEGMEIQAIYNPTRNWNMKLTVGQQEASFSDAIGELTAWITQRKPQWQALVAPDIPNEITRYNGNKLFLANFWSGYGFTQGAQFNDAPSNTTGGTGSPGSTYSAIVEPDLFSLTAKQGTKVDNLREWTANFITNYAFQEGRLKGFAVGGSVRWQDSAVATYYGETDPSRYSHPSGSAGPEFPPGTVRAAIVYPDLNRPIITPSETNVDLWCSYTTRILDDKARMKIQLNIRDAFENGGLTPVSFNMDGSIAQYRIKDPRQYFVTTTFTF